MSIKTKIYWCVIFICLIIIMFSVENCRHKKQENEYNKIIETTQMLPITEEPKESEESTVTKITDTTEIKEEYINVFATKNIEIKKEPNADSETIGIYDWNTEITVTYINDNWAKVKDTGHYINKLFISENSAEFVNYDVPENNSIKSYMDYRRITSVSSNQYRLQGALAYTGNYGIRMVNGRYCIAVGSYYTTTIGQYIDVELENGVIIKAILADCKADEHTDPTNRMNPNGSVIEFVVDTNVLDSVFRITGDASYIEGWNSKVVNIRVYDKIEEY